MDTLQVAASTLEALKFEYARQMLAALLPASLTVLLHGVGMDVVRRFYKHSGRPLLNGTHVAGRSAVLLGIVMIMLLTHFGEIVLWAIFYFLTDMMPSFKHAMFFSVNSYTTMGSSNLSLPDGWHGFSGFEAMTAMLMFGWSTAMLASIIQKFHSIDD